MGKYRKKKSGKGTGLIAVLAVLVLASGLLAAWLAGSGDAGATGETEPPVTTPVQEIEVTNEAEENRNQEETPPEQETQVATILPLELEDGKLIVSELFQYEGLNPDCGNQEGKSIAAIMVRNASDAHLAEADVTLTLNDGTTRHFVVMDLPAGRNAMAFDTDNAAITDADGVAEAQCSAVFDENAGMEQDKLSISVEGMLVTVTNISGETISEAVIYCRAPLGEDYFGGKSFIYTVNNLSPGGQTEIMAVDCIIGMVEVVRVVMK